MIEEQIQFLDLLKSMLNVNYHAQLEEVKQSLASIKYFEQALENEKAKFPYRHYLIVVDPIDDPSMKESAILVVNPPQPESATEPIFHQPEYGKGLIEQIKQNESTFSVEAINRADWFDVILNQLNHEEKAKASRQWELSTINKRVERLKQELQMELSKKKKYRSQAVIDYIHNSLNSLKKWRWDLSE